MCTNIRIPDLYWADPCAAMKLRITCFCISLRSCVVRRNDRKALALAKSDRLEFRPLLATCLKYDISPALDYSDPGTLGRLNHTLKQSIMM